MKCLMLALVAAVAFSGAAHAAPAAEKPKVDRLYLPYEKPGVFAKLANGDTIHIKCMGSGSPTVVLTAGAGDWSAAWRRVQPQIAKTTRVCAWDRPGFGFSSGTTQAQTVINTTADLEGALKVARIDGPYIAVGHSLGGYESLLFADQNPKSVVGMVLVDPSIPDQMKRLRKATPAFVGFMDQQSASDLRLFDRCIAGVKSGKLTPGAKDSDGCLSYAPDYPPKLAAALARRDTNPLRFTAAKSMEQNFERDGELVLNPQRTYGDMPLIVLSATKFASWADKLPQAAKKELPAEYAEWIRGHNEIAALSSRGVNRPIANATHYIHYDQPKAVIDAVAEVVAAARPNGASAEPR